MTPPTPAPTPGPWGAVRNPGTYRFWTVVAPCCSDPDHDHRFPCVASRLIEPDARLIASAPDLQREVVELRDRLREAESVIETLWSLHTEGDGCDFATHEQARTFLAARKEGL